MRYLDLPGLLGSSGSLVIELDIRDDVIFVNLSRGLSFQIHSHVSLRQYIHRLPSSAQRLSFQERLRLSL